MLSKKVYWCKWLIVAGLRMSLRSSFEGGTSSAIPDDAVRQSTQPNNNPMKLKSIFICSVAAVCLAAPQANAQAIDGSIGFGIGGLFGSTSTTISQTAGTTTVDFGSNGSGPGGTPPGTGTGRVLAGSGNYTGTNGQLATFSDFSFTGSGLGATLQNAPVNPLWTFTILGTTYSFRLDSIIAGTYSNDGNVQGIGLVGRGVAFITGFDPTPGIFTLEGSAGVPGAFNLIFSTTTVRAGVPDGGATVALLGITMMGIAAVRRKLGRA